MKLFGRTVTSPVTLLPVDTFQRHLLSGLAGLLIWFVALVWPMGEAFEWPWQGGWPKPLLEGLTNHLQGSSSDLIYTMFNPGNPDSFWTMFVAEWPPRVIGLLSSILGVALLASSTVMILGAFKFITYPTRLQRFPPIVLSILIITVVAIQIVVLPITAINDVVFPAEYSQPEFNFRVMYWVSGMLTVITQLVVPISVLLLSLVPIFAPEKKEPRLKKLSR